MHPFLKLFEGPHHGLPINVSAQKVLVVDDMAVNRILLSKVLQSEGFDVEEAQGGEIALQMMSRENFSVVVTDVEMPEMNGFEFIDRARDAGHESVIIAMSGDSDPEIETNCYAAGADEYLRKPLDLARFKMTIRNFLRKSPAATVKGQPMNAF